MGRAADRFQDTAASLTSLLDRRWREEGGAEWCRLIDADGQAFSVLFDELMRRAMGYAHALGPVEGRRKEVGICLHHGRDLHAAFVGTLWAGHVPMMLPPPSPRMESAKYARNLRHTLECVRPAALVLDAQVHQQLIHEGSLRFATTEILDPDGVTECDRIDPWEPKPSDIALIQHSSGTTGLQKGIALSHEAILNHHRSYTDRLDMTTDDVIVSWLPLYHDMGFVACFLLPLLSGIRLVELSPFDWVRRPAQLFIQIHKHRGTLCWLPNFAFAFMAQSINLRNLHDETDIGSIRAWINCSEPVTHEAMQDFLSAFSKIGARENQFSASYAMAENVFAVTQSFPGPVKLFHADRKILLMEGRAETSSIGDTKTLVSNGTPVEGTSVQILDESARSLAERQVGEIAIKGSTLFSGYYRREDFTAAAMTADGWYRSGDLGFIHDGQVFVSGRKKDVIVVQGRKYYPQDIEDIVSRVDGIAPGRAVAFGLRDEAAGTEKLVILAEPRPHRIADLSRLALAIRTAVAQEVDCTPGAVHVVPPRSLVKSSSGKIARSDNREKFCAGGF